MMDAHIQVAPIATLERLNDPAWNRAGRTLYDSGSLTFMPGRPEIRLLIDHDENRQVGVVRRLYREEEPDGPWICASCHVTTPPRWLGRGTPASFAYHPTAESSFTQPGDADHIRDAWVTEVSILSPGTKPAEPRAQVTTLLQPAEQPTPAAAQPPARPAPTRAKPASVPVLARRLSPQQRNHRAEDAELRRRMDWLESQGLHADLEVVHRNMRRELDGPSLDDFARDRGIGALDD